MAEKPTHFDIIIIGGGTAGLKAALDCTKRKLKVAMIDPGMLGGTCLNTGCIPSKAMLHASHLYKQLHGLDQFGISVQDPKVDFPKLMRRVQGMVDYGQQHIKFSIKNSYLATFKEKASFEGKTIVRAGKELLASEHILLSTGSRNRALPIKGLESIRYYTNENMMSMKTLPKSLILIGGGYISMEYATFFNELGSKVTVVESMPQILGMLDGDVANGYMEISVKDGISVRTNTKVVEVREKGNHKEVIVEEQNTKKGMTFQAEEIVVAVGRVPNTESLNLEAAGIKIAPHGGIAVNEFMQTSNPRVYAVGDVTGQAMFAHSATREAHIALANMLDNKKLKANNTLVPWVAFTDPPISGIGLSEKETKEKKLPYSVWKANFARAGRTRIMEESSGFAKLIVNKKTNHIEGAVLVGARSDDLIHEIAAIMNSASPTLETLQKTIHVHPTVSEVFEALREVSG